MTKAYRCDAGQERPERPRWTPRPTGSRGGGDLPLVCGIRLEHEFANTLLSGGVSYGSQQRERTTFTVHRVLASRKGHVATGAAARFPDAKADQLEAFERASGEMQLGVGEFSWEIGRASCRERV